jgi:hypothetical protein
MKPVARRENLILKELPGELLVYDTVRHEAHCLNAPAALVFKHSDGKTGVKELAKRLRRELGSGADESWVWLALDRLDKAHLLEEGLSKPAHAPARREMLKRFGRAAALPVVVSLLAPTPAGAAATGCVASCSGKPDGTPCEVSPGDLCQDGFVCCNSGTSCQANCP